MNPDAMKEAIPKFYGASTIGERGQLVIPAEARKDMGLTPATKVMVFGNNFGEGLLIIKAESVAELVANASRMLSDLQNMLNTHDDNPDELR